MIQHLLKLGPLIECPGCLVSEDSIATRCGERVVLKVGILVEVETRA